MKQFIEKYNEHLIKMRVNVAESNYLTCRRLSTDVIRHSLFMGYPVEVLIGECLESIFDSLLPVFENYEVEPDDQERIELGIYRLIDYLTKNIPIKTKKQKIELFDLYCEVRYLVTDIQVAYLRDKKSSRSMPSDFPELILREP